MGETREHSSCRSYSDNSEQWFIGQAYERHEELVVIAAPDADDISPILGDGQSVSIQDLTDRIDVVLFCTPDVLAKGRVSHLEDELTIKEAPALDQRIVVREQKIYCEQAALDTSQSSLVGTLSMRVCKHSADDLVGFMQNVLDRLP